MGAYSFHDTKNVMSGEGGALLINDQRFVARVEVIREKGTNRSQFFRGQVDKYTWVDVGSSYLPGEIIAAFLWAQLEEAAAITNHRLELWNSCHTALAPLEDEGLLRRPIIPQDCQHNAHIYYVLFDSLTTRTRTIEGLRNNGVQSVSHYVPLHLSPAAKRYARTHGRLTTTVQVSDCLLRLPLWIGLDRILDIVQLVGQYARAP